MGRASLLRVVLGLILLGGAGLLPVPGSPPARAAAQAAATPPAAAPNELLVGFRPGTPEAEVAAVVARRGGRLIRRLPEVAAALITLPPQRAATATAELANDGEVAYVEPNYRYQIAATPNDPRWGDLWGLAAIGAPAAWDTTTGSQGVVVGVLDTGIAYNHPDLAANVWTAPPGWNVKGCGPGSRGYRTIGGATTCDPQDDQSHGTHVAGTIGAAGNNGQGVVGVNWRVSLLALKALDSNGFGTVGDVVEAINIAVAVRQAGVNLRVLNLSLGGPGRSETLRAALALANDAGILVVAAAGNNGTNNDDAPSYPASFGAAPDNLPNIIAVAANQKNGNRLANANYGPASVHLSAPGEAIWSTVPGPAVYNAYSGTSMAAAHVSGAAALLLSGPGLGGLGAGALKARLLDCGDDQSPAPGTITNRRLNVARALANTDCTPRLYSVAAMASPTMGGTVEVTPTGPDYQLGAVVTVRALPQPGYRFAGWRVDAFDQGTINPLSLTVAHNHTVVAIFAQETYGLTLAATAGGSATASPAGGPYPAGTVVQLTASANAGSVFAGWTIDGTAVGSANPWALTMDRNHTALASFVAAPPPGSTVALDLAATGPGTATADPPVGPYPAGGTVRLTATPGQGAVFTGWIVDGTPYGVANPLTLTMIADRTVRATFAPGALLLLSETAGGDARATAVGWSGGSPYPVGTVVTLTATTTGDSIFTGWTVDGTFQGWANPLTITMDRQHVVVANFAKRKRFDDLPPGPPPYEAISQLAARLIILGYNSGDFGPQDTTQRAQMAALIARAMGWDLEDHSNPFADQCDPPGPYLPTNNCVVPVLWRNVGTLAFYGVAKGYGNGTFGTFNPVLQAQVISFIARGMVAQGRWVAATADDPALYPNVPGASGQRLDLITYHRNAGPIPGTDPAQPWATWTTPATRGWFAEALWQALDAYFRVDRVP